MSDFFWTNPDGLWSLAALAAVTAAYLFYRRYKPLPVTGLFLWGVPGRDAGGGRMVQPPVFGRRYVFDMLAALCLSLALAGPAWRIAGGKPLVVVLDESFAMHSLGGADTARALAVALVSQAGPGGGAVILAGDRPTQLASFATPPGETARLLARYWPGSHRGNLLDAVTLARQVYGDGLDLRILTNQAESPGPVAGCDVTVHRLAGQGGNLAFGALWRTGGDDPRRERVIFSVDNHGVRPVDATLRIEDAASGALLFETGIALAAGGGQYREIDIADADRLTLRLVLTGSGQDVIAEDSVAWLAPGLYAPVGYAVEGLLAPAAVPFRLGLEAAGCVPAPGWETAELLVTNDAKKSGTALTLEVPDPDNPGLVRPPLVVDGGSALCRDVHLAGLPWVVAVAAISPDVAEAFILAGDMPLLWRSSDGRLHMNVVSESGPLARSIAWPALMANLAEEAASLRPGLGKTGYLPGERVRFRGDAAGLAVYPAEQDGSPTVLEGNMAVPVVPGWYRIGRSDEMIGEVTVLPLFGPTSDTTGLAAEAAEVLYPGAADSGGTMELRWLLLPLGLAFLALNWKGGRGEGR